jgi:hypothetical protein
MRPESDFDQVYEDFLTNRKDVVLPLTQWIETLYNPSLNAMLDTNVLLVAIRNSARRIIDYPQLIMIHGFPLSLALPGRREQWLGHYFHQPSTVFTEWFNKNVSNDANLEVKTGIIDRSKRYFAQWWLHELGGNSADINWDMVGESYHRLLDGESYKLYPAFTIMHNGIQIATIEEFAQSTAPMDLFGPQSGILQ